MSAYLDYLATGDLAAVPSLKDFYAAKGLLVCVAGREEVKDTTADVMKALSKFEA